MLFRHIDIDVLDDICADQYILIHLNENLPYHFPQLDPLPNDYNRLHSNPDKSHTLKKNKSE